MPHLPHLFRRPCLCVTAKSSLNIKRKVKHIQGRIEYVPETWILGFESAWRIFSLQYLTILMWRNNQVYKLFGEIYGKILEPVAKAKYFHDTFKIQFRIGYPIRHYLNTILQIMYNSSNTYSQTPYRHFVDSVYPEVFF